MKPIFLNMREMTLSKEVYDKKPGKFFSIFIYGLLIIVVTALVWAYFGRLDIVIRAQGIIRPNAQTAMVINAVGGEVRDVFFYEGQQVSRGDVLYVVDTFHLENERRLFVEQLDTLEFELATLELFHASIEAGENLINSFNEEFSSRFDTFLVNMYALQHGASSQLSIFIQEGVSLEEAIEYARFELEMLRTFENSILREMNLFGTAQTSSGRNREVRNAYRSQYLLYELELDNLHFQIQRAQSNLEGYQIIREFISGEQEDLMQLNPSLEAHALIVENYGLEMDNLRLQIEITQATLSGQQMIRASINAGYSIFPEGNGFTIYGSMFDQYMVQLNQLILTHSTAEEQYATHAVLYEAGLISRVERQAAEARMDNAYTAFADFRGGFLMNTDNAIQTAENRIIHLENQVDTLHVSTIASITNAIRTAESQLIQLENQVSALHIDTLAAISSQMLSLETALLELAQALSQSRLQQDAMFFVDDESGDAAMLRLGEINRTLGQINAIEQEITRFVLSIEGLDAQINDSTVRAPIDGEVAVHTELTAGGFVLSGVQVLSILPTREEMLNAHIFVNNVDIGRISEGMVVSYDIAALPRRDFGEIAGTVTRISADIATDGGAQGFFIVESEIEDRTYYDTRGNGVDLRVGMAFEARIVVERQRILFYLLDRLNLLVNR